jgi:hypothetical protein
MRNVTIGVDATHLPPGLHEGTVTFLTPEADPLETVIPVRVDVFPASG